jgi:tetratricopeptide (TPR) repeat protein
MDLGRGHLQLGRPDLAIETYQRALDIMGSDASRSPSMGLAYASAGRRDEALAILQRLQAPPRRTPPWAIASIYHALGDEAHTLDWLEKACEERDRALVWLKVHPRFDTLRAHPRYQALLTEMKFPD